jgi:glyoxylase I family protein
VRDVSASAAWYERVFDVRPIMESDDGTRSAVVTWHDEAKLAICVGSHVANDGAAFDECRTGLDHLSFRVKDRAALEAWAKRLDELGIPYSPIADEPYGSVLVLRDPDNIQLELFANPPR